MASSSSSIDKLPVEIRVQIYEYIYGSSTFARRMRDKAAHKVQPRHADGRLVLFAPATVITRAFDTAIFTVNKKMSAEALEMFYSKKTIRITFAQLHHDRDKDYQALLHEIEIIDCTQALRSPAGFAAQPSKNLVQAGLRIALNLPKMRSVTVHSDSLGYVPDLRESMAVVEWANAAELGGVVCEDIGLYRLLGSYAGVKVVNSKLRKMWPDVASTPVGYDALQEARNVYMQWDVGASVPDLMAWASQTSLQIWVGLWEMVVRSQGLPPPLVISSGYGLQGWECVEVGLWANKSVLVPTQPYRNEKMVSCHCIR
ncbi:hypothetical protein LTR85_002439 [Meristemomyces frigidus]|nr:hypothetical protein LTR85_002439 [Meristemomyces frigidus]